MKEEEEEERYDVSDDDSRSRSVGRYGCDAAPAGPRENREVGKEEGAAGLSSWAAASPPEPQRGGGGGGGGVSVSPDEDADGADVDDEDDDDAIRMKSSASSTSCSCDLLPSELEPNAAMGRGDGDAAGDDKYLVGGLARWC